MKTPQGRFKVNARLIGSYNVSNILASAACAVALDVRADAILEGIESISFVPGRLEGVDAGQNFKVFVDYAHTEDALNNVLGLLKSVADRRIITVFGCGGNRDRKKRPLMGHAACKYSDRVIVTSDNPRFEDPRSIIDEIESGITVKNSNYDIVVDRYQAIERALTIASEGDIVLIAGKGHENSQIIRDKATRFDDREAAREILKKLKAENRKPETEMSQK